MTFFYDLNKKLQGVLDMPKSEHKQLNERDMGKHNNATTGFKAVADKAAKEYGSKAAGERVAGAVKAKMAKAGKLEEQEVDEGIGSFVQKMGAVAKKGGVSALKKLGHGSDEDLIKDLQKKAGLPQTGQKPVPTQTKEAVDQVAFAALAEPKDKITFADKIAGAKKEVDEMLGDVAAEAIKGALTGGQKKLDKNKNGKIDGQDLAMLRKGKKQVADEGWDDMIKDVEKRHGQMKTGEKIKGHKGEIEKTATGIKHTRSYDAKTGETDSGDDAPAAGEKRGRGRPKKAGGPRQERVTAKSRKADRTAYQGKKKAVGEGEGEGSDLVKLAKVIQSCTSKDQLEAARKMAQNFLRKHAGNDLASYGPDTKRKMDVVSDIKRKQAELQGGQELDEKAVSKKQQKFMGMVHAAQKGEKPASKEVAKVAKTMKKSDAEDFASTKHKGLPEKKKPEAKKEAPKKKKEKTEEAGGTGTPTASSGFSYGKGIYDSINLELESMIAESMSINVSSSTEGGKNITVTASEEDAVKLAEILKSAGLGGDSEGYGGTGYQSACGCGQPDCSCDSEEQVDENSPDWPTNTETSNDALQYSGGLNKPKSSGMATIPVTDVVADGEDRFGQPARVNEGDDELNRIREIAGIKEAKKVEEDDVEEGNKFTGNLAKARAAGKSEADLDGDGDMEKVRESVDQGILDATANLWSEYKGKYGV